jgi:MerR family transcriptional regulator/heat shock protein HspR
LADIELLRRIADLTAEGLGLEGVKRVIELEHRVAALSARVVELQTELDAAHTALGTVANLPVRASAAQVTVYRRH